MTLSDWLEERYTPEQLEELAEDGCNWGGKMTNELYFEYYSDIWAIDNLFSLDTPIGKFANHTDFARYMLSEAVKYYAERLCNE